ncbi:MAG TPA: hypothetical protein VMR31_15865 [Myxococcota bacterium]|nr:hypothetical protein [Myxococcota bacterium]
MRARRAARVAAPPQQALVLQLAPAASAALPVPPSGKPRDAAGASYAGFVSFADLDAGLYQVSLGGPGWLDVVQNRAALPAGAHASLHECPVLRKSVRFRVAKGPAKLELSAVPSASLGFAIRRVD